MIDDGEGKFVIGAIAVFCIGILVCVWHFMRPDEAPEPPPFKAPPPVIVPVEPIDELPEIHIPDDA